MSKHQGYSKLSLRRNELLKRWGGCAVTESQKLILSLKIPSHGISVLALSETLAGFSDLLECLRQEATDSKGIEIKVEALEPGSFEICLNLINLVQSASPADKITLITGGVIILTELIRLLTSYLQCKAALGGKKAETVESDGEQSIINGNQHVTNQVFNIYTTSQKTAGACSRFTNGIKSDKRITGLELRDQNGEKLLNFNSEQIERLSAPNPYMEEDLRVVRERAALRVNMPSLDCRRQWVCTYHGERVNVVIKDKAFLEMVKSGIFRFANNDPLDVELEIEMRKNLETGLWENRKYTVLSVDLEELMSLPRQQMLF